MKINATKIGSEKDQLDTPALCIDLDAMDRNIQSMVTTCRQHKVDWRPHAKCHKSPAIAQILVDAGAIGVTCAKLSEAELMVDAGIADLLIANMIVGPLKIARLVELRRLADPICSIDHLDQAIPMSDAMQQAGLCLRVVIEVDIGMKRVGVTPGEQALKLAKQIVQLPGLELVGLMGYEGHLLTISDPEEKSVAIHQALDQLLDTKNILENADIPCSMVSCGGTGSYQYAVTHPGVTEIQAGGAIFMDAFYRELCNVKNLEFALTLVVTVVSRPTAERAIVDAGRKTMNMEIFMPQVVGRNDIQFISLSAEHGELRLDASAQDLKIGDRLEVVPGYGDLTTVLHENFYCFRRGRLEEVWPLVARGKLN